MKSSLFSKVCELGFWLSILPQQSISVLISIFLKCHLILFACSLGKLHELEPKEEVFAIRIVLACQFVPKLPQSSNHLGVLLGWPLFVSELGCYVTETPFNAIEFLGHLFAENVGWLLENFNHFFHIVFDVLTKIHVGHFDTVVFLLENPQLVNLFDNFTNFLAFRVKIVLISKLDVRKQLFKFSSKLFLEDKSMRLLSLIEQLNPYHSQIFNFIIILLIMFVFHVLGFGKVGRFHIGFFIPFDFSTFILRSVFGDEVRFDVGELLFWTVENNIAWPCLWGIIGVNFQFWILFDLDFPFWFVVPKSRLFLFLDGFFLGEVLIFLFIFFISNLIIDEEIILKRFIWIHDHFE